MDEHVVLDVVSPWISRDDWISGDDGNASPIIFQKSLQRKILHSIDFENNNITSLETTIFIVPI